MHHLWISTLFSSRLNRYNKKSSSEYAYLHYFYISIRFYFYFLSRFYSISQLFIWRSWCYNTLQVSNLLNFWNTSSEWIRHYSKDILARTFFQLCNTNWNSLIQNFTHQADHLNPDPSLLRTHFLDFTSHKTFFLSINKEVIQYL